MRLKIVVLVLLAALLTGVVAPVQGSTVRAASVPSHVAATHTNANAQAFDKTRFVLHLGIAAFLVHYIYKKYKEGKLGRFHIFTDIKAAAAALIAYHEMKVAYNIAKTSNSKTLQLLIKPMTTLTAAIQTTRNKLVKGDTSTVGSMNNYENSLQGTAKSTPYSFKDQTPPKNETPGF